MRFLGCRSCQTAGAGIRGRSLLSSFRSPCLLIILVRTIMLALAYECVILIIMVPGTVVLVERIPFPKGHGHPGGWRCPPGCQQLRRLRGAPLQRLRGGLEAARGLFRRLPEFGREAPSAECAARSPGLAGHGNLRQSVQRLLLSQAGGSSRQASCSGQHRGDTCRPPDLSCLAHAPTVQRGAPSSVPTPWAAGLKKRGCLTFQSLPASSPNRIKKRDLIGNCFLAQEMSFTWQAS